ncbi:hypothetical protein JCM18899A_29420 [Nocardioides sp. AN3]
MSGLRHCGNVGDIDLEESRECIVARILDIPSDDPTTAICKCSTRCSADSSGRSGDHYETLHFHPSLNIVKPRAASTKASSDKGKKPRAERFWTLSEDPSGDSA